MLDLPLAYTRLRTRIATHWYEDDKRLHAGWSFGLMALAAAALPIPHAFLVVTIIGLVKECWDHYYGSGFCGIDVAANTVGIAAAVPFAALAPYSGLWRWMLG